MGLRACQMRAVRKDELKQKKETTATNVSPELLRGFESLSKGKLLLRAHLQLLLRPHAECVWRLPRPLTTSTLSPRA